jgi:hypothetical protein
MWPGERSTDTGMAIGLAGMDAGGRTWTIKQFFVAISYDQGRI